MPHFSFNFWSMCYFKILEIWSANSFPILSWASFVAAPMWGVNEILGCINSLISGFGSFSKVSKPAKETFPDSNADKSSNSLITPPLAALTIPTPFYINSNSFLSITYWFWAGTWRLIKSDFFNNSSSGEILISKSIEFPPMKFKVILVSFKNLS